MVFDIKVLPNLSVTLPIIKVLNSDSNRFLLSADINSASLVKPGQPFSLFAHGENGIARVRDGAIRSVSKNTKGLLIDI